MKSPVARKATAPSAALATGVATTPAVKSSRLGNWALVLLLACVLSALGTMRYMSLHPATPRNGDDIEKIPIRLNETVKAKPKAALPPKKNALRPIIKTKPAPKPKSKSKAQSGSKNGAKKMGTSEISPQEKAENAKAIHLNKPKSAGSSGGATGPVEDAVGAMADMSPDVSPQMGSDVTSDPMSLINCRNQTACVKPALQLTHKFKVMMHQQSVHAKYTAYSSRNTHM